MEFINLFIEASFAQLLAPVFVFISVTSLCSWYVGKYFLKSISLAKDIKILADRVMSLKSMPEKLRREQLDQLFSGSSIEHSWKEYAETLHDQYEIADGEQQLLRSRATSSASHFFTAQSVVETPLGTEFYKHLPGVLTGIGIVGTFFGLMLGLYHFDPSTPEQVSSSVDQLIKDVLFAFLGSFFSIAASIAVTLTEKWRLGLCYKNLEQLTESIDALFDSGVGEEYLAELVKASNESSIQTRQLKDSLVTDLREMLQNLVDTQVRENLRLGETIGNSIENSLRGPLEQIAGAVNTVSGNQSQQVQGLLTDVLTAFMSKLETTFGQQFNGLHEMLGQSVAAMQSMQQGFNSLIGDMRAAGEASSENSAKMIGQLLADMQAGQQSIQSAMNSMLADLQTSVAKIGSAGEGAGERMAAQMEALFAQSEARQQAMAANMQTFIETMQDNMGKGQQDTMAKISGSVDSLGEHLNGLFTQLEANRTQMDQASKSAQEDLHRGTREMIGSLEQQVSTLLNAVAEQNAAASNTVKLLSAQTEQHLLSMQQGAEKMRVAAERFESAGLNVEKASNATANTLVALQGTSSDLVNAARDLTTVVEDYRSNREALNTTLTTMQGLLATTQGDATARAQYLQDLQQHNAQLQALNREVNEYLVQFSDVLAKGFSNFEEHMDRTLSKTLGALDLELNKAITHLASGVEGIKDSLDDFSDVIERAQRS